MRTRNPITVLGPDGRPLAGAEVYTRVRPTNADADVFASETGPIPGANPAITDARGRVTQWLDRGAYASAVTADGLDPYVEEWDSAPASDGAVDNAWLPDDVVDLRAMGDDAVGSSEIIDGSVGGSELSDTSLVVAGLTAAYEARAERDQPLGHPSLDAAGRLTNYASTVQPYVAADIAAAALSAGTDALTAKLLAQALGKVATTTRTNLSTNPKAGALTTTGHVETTQDPPIFAAVTLGAAGAPAPNAAMIAAGITKGFHLTGDAGGDGDYELIPVVAGHTYQFSVWVWVVSLTATSIRMQIQTPAGVNKYSGSAGSGGSVTALGQWVLLRGSVTADATESWRFGPAWQNGNGAAEWYYSGMLIEEAPNLGVYFDGDTVDCIWTGTANASTSQKRTYRIDTTDAAVARLTTGMKCGVELVGPARGNDGPTYRLLRRWAKDGFWVASLEAENGIPPVGALVNRFTKSELCVPMFTAPGVDGTLRSDSRVAVAGTWATLTGVRSYNGAYRTSVTAGSTYTFTAPTGATRLSHRSPIGPAGGIAKVSIDGSYTRATRLPTAADLYAMGVITAADRDALGATSRCLDFYSYGHGPSSEFWDRINIMLADDLDPTVPHTYVLEYTGKKAAWATGTTIYASGSGYDLPGIAAGQAGVEVLRSRGIFSNSKGAQEYAIRAGATTFGSIHGYETLQSISVYVDGVPVTLVQDAGITWGSTVTVVRETTLQHPDFVGDVAQVETVYTFDADDDAFDVSWRRTWLQGITLLFDLVMAMVDGYRPGYGGFKYARYDNQNADLTLTAHDGTRYGTVQDNLVRFWSDDGLYAEMEVPDERRGLSSWSIAGSFAEIEDRATINGNASEKAYMRRVDSDGAADVVPAGRIDHAGLRYRVKRMIGARTRTAIST